jgi:hypothetical protein
MHWFRSHTSHGSLLALIALVLNLVLSFGHIHAIIGGQRNGLIATAVTPFDGGQTGHHDDGLADDRCPICKATSVLANALASGPPAMAHPIAHIAVDRTAELAVAFFEPSRTAFQSRAPPVS